ncbi:MAG: tRNA preQ1(34) S-adenosylmethionine ribosyltransferase-isomerase QueA [Phycisphaerae bacterium]|nr:tRNA preQ1(34) S-adenosylmethionine ribosyltransferase-isomerase QueA [Phycisphaerae bacterium]
MRTELFDYELPPERIAQTPTPSRSESRLLVLDRKGDVLMPVGVAPTLLDCRFAEVGRFLREGDCLVLNDTKVLPARFFAERKTSASLEGLFLAERPDTPAVWEVMLKGTRKVRIGERIRIVDRHRGHRYEAELIEKRPDGVCLLKIDSDRSAEEILEEVGFPPLPPYIRRDGNIDQAQEDRQRYQTVYARAPGAVAAPTAGLHFTESLLAQLQEQGVRLAWVTLHVGTGTFKPVTTENLEDHEIHHEWYQIDEENARAINEAWQAGGRIVAVGTTATRVLETVASGRCVAPGMGTTGLFITPGYEFKIVDAMITNFHLPRSTLLALVAAFAGLDRTLAAYRHAVAQRYRFYSYGDAMLIL